jgi:hypothetical protein
MLKTRVPLLGGFLLLGILVAFSLRGGSERRRPNRISETGTLLWQGKPFFPIGIYHVSHTPEEYRTLAENGFNMIQGPLPADVETFMKRLDLALNYGLAVDVPLYAGGKVKENLANSLSMVTAAAAHPAVLCWKILDEPDANRNTRVRREVPDAYFALKAAHSNQPIELTLSQDESLKYWANHCDIVQIDRYPVPSRPLTEVFDFCRNAKAVMKPWQPLIFVVQCGWTPDLTTQPTFAQARAMVYLALIGGAKGIAWYSRQENDPNGNREWDLTTSPLWRRLKEINFEVRSLASPVLLGEDVDGIKCGASGIYAAAKHWQDKLYLLVCNPMDRPTEAAFTLPPGIRLRSASAIGLSAEPILDGSNVRVSFGPTDSGTIVCEIGEPSP